MLVCEWTGFLLLIYGMWWWKGYVHWRVPNRQRMGQQETAREITNPNPNNRETEMLINCHMWITSSHKQVLLKVSLSCTSMKKTKQWSKLSSKGRSPTMRHVSRTHRVAVDSLLDRINLDPKIQIRYVDTKNQPADTLTGGSFARDGWDHLLRLLNILNFSMFSCSHLLSNRKQSIMSKWAQESTAKEGSALAKPRPMNLVSRNLLRAKQTSPKDSGASNSPRNQELDQCFVSSSVRKLVRSGECASSGSTRKLVRGDDNQIERTRVGFRDMQISNRQYLERVFQNLRQRLNLAEEAPVLDLMTNVLIWGFFRSTMKIWKYTGTPTSKRSRNCSISRRDWYWNMKSKLWMYPRLIGKSLHGRDPRLCTIKYSSRRRQKYTSTQTPSCAWRRCKSIQKRTKDGMLNQRWVESPSVFIQYYELLDVFLSPFLQLSFRRSWSKTQCRKEARRRARMKILQRRKRSHVWCCASVAKEWENFFTKFGISGQSGVCRWKKRIRKSNQATGALRLKLRNRTSSSESTREFSKSQQETGARESKPNRNWREYFLTPRAQGNFQLHHQNWKTWNTRTINQYMSKIFICLRKKLGMTATISTFTKEAHKTNVLMWGMFMTPSMEVVIHLGPNFKSNSEKYKNTKFEEIESVFNITQKLVRTLKKLWMCWTLRGRCPRSFRVSRDSSSHRRAGVFHRCVNGCRWRQHSPTWWVWCCFSAFPTQGCLGRCSAWREVEILVGMGSGECVALCGVCYGKLAQWYVWGWKCPVRYSLAGRSGIDAEGLPQMSRTACPWQVTTYTVC